MDNFISDNIPGVLILKNNHTYNTLSSNKNYYKCIPRNNNLFNNKTFLIPYNKKNSFNKIYDNLYIIFSISNDHIDNNIIIANLKEVIGPTTSYEAFQKYELCSRGLYNSLQLHNKYIKYKCNLQDINPHLLLPFNDNNNIITIDNDNSLDLDDAISTKIYKNDKDEDIIEISTHISLVSYWLDIFDNWQFICNNSNIRINTIYLPNGEIRPIFPPLLSNKKMSLLSDDNLKPVLTTIMIYNINTKILIDYIIKPEFIYIKNNYNYNSIELINNSTYISLINFTYPNLSNNNDIINHSHKLIEHWMIQTNLICGKELKKRNLPAIYKECVDIIDCNIDLHLNWKSYKSKYTLINDNNDDIIHNTLNNINYVHITSPIRRWVDIWNQTLLFNGKPNELMSNFIFNQNGIHIINNITYQIKKIEKNCNLLHKLHSNNNSPIITDGLLYFNNDKNKWNVYLIHYKSWHPLFISSLIDFENKYIKLYNNNNTLIKCSVFYFDYEYNIKKKIKIMIHDI